MRTRTFILVAAAAVAVVAVVVLVRRNRPSVEDDPAVLAITSKGGNVVRDESHPGRPVVSVRLSRNHITDADLQGLERFPDLTAVHLVSTSVTSDGLKHLRNLANLRTLDLRFSPIDDAGLAELRHFPVLEILILRRTRVTDAGLTHLSAVPNLKKLDLVETAVTDAGLRHLKPLEQLDVLELPVTCVTETGLLTLYELGKLHHFPGTSTADNRRPRNPDEVAVITFQQVPVTPAILRRLKDSPNLRRISFPRDQVTDEILTLLSDLGRIYWLPSASTTDVLARGPAGILLLPDENELNADEDKNIRLIDLSDTPVSDTGVSALARLPNLESLHLDRTKVSAKGALMAAGWPRLRRLSLGGVSLSVSDLKALDARKNLAVDGVEVETTDATLKELREAGLLRWLLDESILVSDLDRSDNQESVKKRSRVLRVSGPKVTDAGLQELADFHEFSALEINDTRVTGTGLAALKSHRGLKSLSLEGSPVTDRGLTHVSQFAELESLDLGRTQVTNAGLAKLRGLIRLRRLDLTDTAVTGPGLIHLKDLLGLRNLIVGPSQLTDTFLRSAREAGLLHLLDAASARDGMDALGPADVINMNLTGAPVTDAGLTELRDLVGLKFLGLGGTKVTDAGVKHIVGFPLTGLNLHGTGVTDACVDDLASIRTLRKLRIYNTGVTEAGVERLRAALPRCDIESTAPPPEGRLTLPDDER